MSARNSSGGPCSNVAILSYYASGWASDGFQRILIFMISHLLTSSVSFLISGIGRISIHACTYALSQTGERIMIVYCSGVEELYMMSHVVTFHSAVRVFNGYSKNKQ